MPRSIAQGRQAKTRGVSLLPELDALIDARLAELGEKGFSAYVQRLIAADLATNIIDIGAMTKSLREAQKKYGEKAAALQATRSRIERQQPKLPKRPPAPGS